MKFTHYLITRFNVPVNNWNTDKSGKPVLDDEWLKSRLELFSTYCLPTLKSQDQLSFKWLIYCDLNSSQPFIQDVEDLLSDFPKGEVRLVSDFDHLVKDLKQLMAEVETPYVITSRLDNDDGLGPNFISDIQSHFIEQDGTIINFTKGVLYDAYKKVLTEIRDSRRNHYGSLIEKKKEATQYLTVVGFPHGLPPAGCRIENISTRFSWLKIIHERNMASKTNGIPLFDNGIRAHFNLNKNVLQTSLVNTGLFVLRRMLSKLKRKLFQNK